MSNIQIKDQFHDENIHFFFKFDEWTCNNSQLGDLYHHNSKTEATNLKAIKSKLS